MATQIDLAFGDGTYTFRLPLPYIAELQRKTGVGIGALFARVLAGRYADRDGHAFGSPLEAQYGLADVIEPIRYGLMGGGGGIVAGLPVEVKPQDANRLVETYCYPARPISEAWDLAVAILMACIEGYDEPDAKKKPEEPEPEPMMETTIPKDGSIGPGLSPASPSLDTPSETPTT